MKNEKSKWASSFEVLMVAACIVFVFLILSPKFSPLIGESNPEKVVASVKIDPLKNLERNISSIKIKLKEKTDYSVHAQIQTLISEGKGDISALKSTKENPSKTKKLERELLKLESTAKNRKTVYDKKFLEEKRLFAIENRKAYITQLENDLLMKGMDVHLSLSGKNKDIMNFKYILMSRPFVHQFSQNQDVTTKIITMGFKRINFTDGYDDTYWIDYK